MIFALGPKARDAGYRLASYATIGSTSSEALARAKAGDPGRIWIASLAQTQGHGRRGRAWQSPSGNLAASVLLAAPDALPATLGFVAGLALENAIRAVAPEVALRVALDGARSGGMRLRLKWPNDVLVDGAKVAGVLLEATNLPSGGACVVAGIGVNVAHAPEGVPYPVSSLVACGADISAETLFTALAEAWVEQEAAWNGGGGFAAIREDWLARAAGLGAPVAVSLDGGVIRGTFETIDEEGRLVIRSGDGTRRTVSAGEVHFGAAAGVRR